MRKNLAKRNHKPVLVNTCYWSPIQKNSKRKFSHVHNPVKKNSTIFFHAFSVLALLFLIPITLLQNGWFSNLRIAMLLKTHSSQNKNKKRKIRKVFVVSSK